MNIADRIQQLRKMKGISQEELAEGLGVSRQAVSKWESEQSMPDLDRIILMSEYFEVTTDYLLKGIEKEERNEREKPDAGIFAITGTVFNFMGLAVSAAVFYEEQTATATAIALIFMALGCMIFGIGMVTGEQSGRKKAKRSFWMVNIWFLSFVPLSLVFNILAGAPIPAPYPFLKGRSYTLGLYGLFWVFYIVICAAVDVVLFVRQKRKKSC